MSTNHTPNYNLSQWERTDKVMMEDFNADNAKIDGALAEHAARLSKLGNCRVENFTFYDDCTHTTDDNPMYIQFSAMPTLFVLFGQRYLMVGNTDSVSVAYGYNAAGIGGGPLNWVSGNRLRLLSIAENKIPATFQVVAFYAQDAK